MRIPAVPRAALVVAVGAALVASAPLATASTTTSTTTSGATPATTTQNQAGGVQPKATSPVAYDFGETLATLQGRTLETTFLAEIISHHKAAIAMAKLERERGKDPDIRTHADNIIASQSHQVQQFTTWLKQWYGLTPEQAMAQAPRKAQLQMAALERDANRSMAELRKVPAGNAFDVAFVRSIIPHHNAGVIEFLEPQARAPHAELRVAAASGITMQESEIADFRTWLSGRTR